MINSIEQRQNTIERITRKILEKQEEFFVHGILQTPPHDYVSNRRGNRCSRNHSLPGNRQQISSHAPRSFSFKYFFTPGYSGKDGEAVSNTSVKEIIGSIIEQEDPKKPLSDRAIVDVLAKRDIKLARRTVAKYREELGIAPTNLRRQY